MLYNGALGTVKSFSFRKLPKRMETLRPEYAAYKEDLIKREFPVIFVQMDQLAIDPTTGLPISCDPDLPRLVPFTYEKHPMVYSINETMVILSRTI